MRLSCFTAALKALISAGDSLELTVRFRGGDELDFLGISLNLKGQMQASLQQANQRFF